MVPDLNYGAIMSTTQRLVCIILALVCVASPVQAVRSPSGTNLEEINHHQAAASAALILGDHTLLEKGDFSFSGQGYLSGWGDDALYGSWGLSMQARPGRRLGVGLSYGYADAQLHTRAWLLNGQYTLVSEPESWLQLQGAVGYQYLDSSESGNVMIFEFDNAWPVQPANPHILLDDMNWTHGYLGILLNLKVWRFGPQANFGYMYSHYSWSGWEVPAFGGLEAGPGPALSGSGNTDTFIGSFGLGLDLGPVRPFASLASFTGSVLFLARITIVF